MNKSFEEVYDYFKTNKTILLTNKNEYHNVTQSLKAICQECEKEYQISYFNFKRKEHKTCQPCAKKIAGNKKTILISRKELEIFDDIIILSKKEKYEREEKVKCQCVSCKEVFEERCYLLFRKKKKNLFSCSKCNRKNKIIKQRKNTFEKTKQFCESNNIDFVSTENEFISGDEYFICNKCQNRFHRPHKYFNRVIYPNRTNLCQKCSDSRPISSEEEKIKSLLKEHKIDFISNDRTVLNGKELDIHIPSKKIAIEINGLYYHSELNGIDKNYHLNKTIDCEKQNIQLLHFWDYEVNNKFEVVKDIILSKLGIYKTKIGARKLKIMMIDSKNARNFMDNNHLHGFCSARWHIGLTLDDELYCLISVGKSRTDNNYEIIRFASQNGVNIIGGYSKLIKYIRDKLKINNLISFADRRISNGYLYLKSGWQMMSSSSPCYWYFKNKQIFHRSNFMKYKLKKIKGFDENQTEWQNMITFGYDRVWDCGNLKFIFHQL